jgi:hypothetical protein
VGLPAADARSGVIGGLPLSLYSDRHDIFHARREPTIVEQLHNQRPLTQFGRAMEELGTSIIPAYSPQAEGRIERLWGVLQDRLVVELRLASVATLAGANALLDRYLPGHNGRFGVAAREQSPVWRPPPDARRLDRIQSRTQGFEQSRRRHFAFLLAALGEDEAARRVAAH